MGTEKIDYEKIGATIVDAAFHIHANLGSGLLESVYQMVLSRELARKGLFVEAKKSISFDYDGLWFDDAFEADIVVEHAVVIEIKSVAQLAPVHYMQLRSYLRLLDYRMGFLINFGSPVFKAGIKRIVNNYEQPSQLSPRR